MLLAGKPRDFHLEDAGGIQHFWLEAPFGSRRVNGCGRMSVASIAGGDLGAVPVVVGDRLVHEGIQGRQLFLLIRDDGGPSPPHDALEVAGVVAGHLTAGNHR